MKKVYWRPPYLSRTAMSLVAMLALAALATVESLPVERKQSHYQEKIAAARLARRAMEVIKAEKVRLGYGPDFKVDPAGTGMIGQSVTPVTSNTGFLAAKLTTTNPNWAAVILDMLVEAGVKKDDIVAVGVSGSFPALNVSTYAALKVLGARPIVVASTSSSEWGANHVNYLWLDMERTLREAQLFDFTTAAASYGGIDDLGIGITQKGISFIDEAITRNGVRKLEPTSLLDSIERRMALYDELAGDAPIRAYINVGGGSASVGTHVGKKQFRPGLNREPPRSAGLPDSVMLRFANRDVPVIHISRLKLLAERFGLPYEPRLQPPIGQGRVFVDIEYDRWLTLGAVVVVLGAMLAFLRWDVGMRVLRGMRPRDKSQTPQPMV